MVPVASLLNPTPPSSERFRDYQIHTFKKYLKQPSSPLAPLKKQKMSKAAATFVKGETKGDVNYPPYEIQDEATAAEHERFEVQPVGKIGEFPKRIPYNSEKKTFQQKTGMDGFEVFLYTFRMPDDARDKDAHTVMWDYNVGLVRVTSFFKSLKLSKTMPSKVMTANPGLREISHSITGGSISAQGYWVPFDAAKAVAARFCYEIRYVLVPVFGPDFVSMCQKCGDPSRLRFNVNPSIIQQCIGAANANRAQSRESSVAISPRTTTAPAILPKWPLKSLRPTSTKVIDAESGYGTDSERSDKYPGSPDSPRSIQWTPVNSPRSAYLETYPFLQQPQRDITSTPRGLGSPATSHSKRTTHSKRGIAEVDGAFDAESSSEHFSIDHDASPKRRKTPTEITPEMGAAYTLVELNMADATLGQRKPLKRRRASA